jgi:hypothetical protein
VSFIRELRDVVRHAASPQAAEDRDDTVKLLAGALIGVLGDDVHPIALLVAVMTICDALQGDTP